MIVQLSADEEDFAENGARTRQVHSVDNGNRNRYGAKRHRTSVQDLAIHRSGCRGELAAAKAYGVEAPLHVDVYHSVPDIGSVGEVRTRTKSWFDLIVRPNDPLDRYYILVIGNEIRGTSLCVVGGIWGGHACKDEWWKDHGSYGEPAWFVPQNVLETPEFVISKGFFP